MSMIFILDVSPGIKNGRSTFNITRELSIGLWVSTDVSGITYAISPIFIKHRHSPSCLMSIFVPSTLIVIGVCIILYPNNLATKWSTVTYGLRSYIGVCSALILDSCLNLMEFLTPMSSLSLRRGYNEILVLVSCQYPFLRAYPLIHNSPLQAFPSTAFSVIQWKYTVLDFVPLYFFSLHSDFSKDSNIYSK